MIMFRLPALTAGGERPIQVVATVEGKILVAHNEEEAAKAPAFWERVPMETLTVDEWLDVAGHLGRTEP